MFFNINPYLLSIPAVIEWPAALSLHRESEVSFFHLAIDYTAELDLFKAAKT